MPFFDFLRKKPTPAPAIQARPPEEEGVPIDACTEDWRIRGRVAAEGRLLDVLNRRDPISVISAEWAPVDGSAPFEPVPGLRTLDPFDLLLVFARPETMPARSLEESAARRRSKEMFDVLVDLAPFQVVGTVHLYPGLDSSSLLEHSTDLFSAFTGAIAGLADGRHVGPEEPTTILVNRSYLTHVEQVDEVTMRAVLASRGVVLAMPEDDAAEDEEGPSPGPEVASRPGGPSPGTEAPAD